jgi:hypothetical protein
MPTLSQAQIAMYAQSAGMANPQLMAAIAMAESSGRTTAHNPVGLDNSYGLWQINMLGDMGPARRKAIGISRNEELYDPAVNARAAAMILRQQGLKAWSTYTNGAYKRYMTGSSVPAGGGATPAFDPWDPLDILPEGSTDKLQEAPILGGLGDVAEGVAATAETLQKAGAWLGSARNWVRIGYIVGGALLVLVGGYIVAAPVVGSAVASTPVGQAVKKVAGKAKASRTGKAKAPAAKKGSGGDE